MKKPLQIAIDGPVAAGKGTVSRLVAQRLGLLYVDTGAMYRMVALLCDQHNVSWEDEDAIVELIKNARIELRNPRAEERDGRLTTALLNGEDVSWKIRTEKLALGSSIVSTHPKVRNILVEKQQEIAKQQDVIMEGRDITYRVLPNASLKIFLTANELVRSRRRHFQRQSHGIDVNFDQMQEEIKKRDERDRNRSTDPLYIMPDAWVIESSDLNIDKVVDMIVERVRFLKQEQENQKNGFYEKFYKKNF
ncbi:MAG: (d)CMP kinase [Candidatus Woesebacteria bacterium]|jgi:cytidylate kinase